MMKKSKIVSLLSFLFLLVSGELFSQIKLDSNERHRIIINYPNSLDFDYFNFEVLQGFKSESDLISGSGIFSYLSHTFPVTVHYDPQSLSGSYTMYNKEKEVFGAAFILSGIKEKKTGDSLSYYRDILRDGYWFYNDNNPGIFRGVFDKGALLSQSLYKGDTLLEGGNYKDGKPVGEWVSTGEEFFTKSYYDYDGNLIYLQTCTLSDKKLKSECYRELFEKTTKLDSLSLSIDFWYIIDYNKDGTISRKGHYINSITDEPFYMHPDWEYFPYGIHYLYENGKVIQKKYKEVPTEIKYTMEKFDKEGNSYHVKYTKKLN
jgi:hypothetical protein